METQRIIRAVKTPVTLLLLLAFVYLAARWGLDTVAKPIPPRPPEPCVVKQVGPNLTPDHVYVNVFNGSPTNGLAKRWGSMLSADGFKVLRRVNADRADHPKSFIVGHAAEDPEVKLVRAAFKEIEVRADGRIDHSVDVVIGVEQPVPVDSTKLSVPLAGGTACLPDIDPRHATRG